MLKNYFVHGLIIFCIIPCLADNPAENNGSQADGKVGGHEYVDLGLSTLWATCNLGTSSPYETGPYFAWGETEPRTTFLWENYKHFIDFTYNLIEGCNMTEVLPVIDDIGEEISGTVYDVARQEWGDGWRLPTYQDCYELLMYGWNKWKSENGVNGVRAYGPNGKSIFLPACGEGYDDGIIMEGIWGNYWTGTNTQSFTMTGNPIEPSYQAMAFWVDSSGMQLGDAEKYGGMNIRPVISRKDIGLGVGLTDDNLDVSLRYGQGKLSIMGNLDGCTVRVSDISGRILLQCAAQSKIYLSYLTPGIYTATLHKAYTMVTALKIVVR